LVPASTKALIQDGLMAVGGDQLLLQARNHGLRSSEPELHSLARWRRQALDARHGEGRLLEGLLWNGGFQLWRSGLAGDLAAGLAAAERLVRDGAVETSRREIRNTLELEATGPLEAQE
jgi:anthranilate phosphoribosyltransferase